VREEDDSNPGKQKAAPLKEDPKTTAGVKAAEEHEKVVKA